jgi:endonuclease/exonuclease/phosphatase family metal-dependent hydrolase
MPKSTTTSHERGVIILQIDGLSHTQLSHAMEAGNMPFLTRLIASEHYRLHSLYSGMPSSTPAVQAELFYGIKNAVPAFSFKQHEDDDVVMMIEPVVAEKIEIILAQQAEPLLRGGSAYANIFSGGAKESHFCSASMGWGHFFRSMNPLVMSLFFLLNIVSFLRILTLIILELLLALVDLIRGIIYGHNLLKEITFVPTRVAICVLLRELVTIGVKLDATRGLPIIHANFLGYDEQAHRRGPSSAFAHWSLKGIDNAIARIWRTAKRSAYRDYDIWVYSDHGQEKTIPYPQHFGVNVETKIVKIFSEVLDQGLDQGLDQRLNQELDKTTASESDISKFSGEQSQRAQLLGGKKIQKIFRRESIQKNVKHDNKPTTVAMGPVGFIYSPYALSSSSQEIIATALVQNANIPIVMALNDSIDNNKQVCAWTAAGKFYLPADNEKVLGAKHSFLDEVTTDLIDLCRHPDAGDFVISGWRPDQPPFSFRIENGAHAGPGYEETHAFALLPDDTQLADNSKVYWRLLDLRKAALDLLGRHPLPKVTNKKPLKPIKKNLRVMTYNVHSCMGMDAKLSPQRIARVIAQYQPDIIALQELDVGRERTNSVDQAQLIANLLEMDFHFYPAIHIEEERYGDAILTRLPMNLIKAGHLPMPKTANKYVEPRGVLWVQVEYQGNIVNVMNTHLGLTLSERRLQVKTLLSKEWLAHPQCHHPIILCGDFNAAPWQSTCRQLSTVLRDVQIQRTTKKLNTTVEKPKNTFSGRYPTVRIDHIFVDLNIKIDDVKVPMTSLTRVASDHLPLIVDLKINCTDS